MSLPSDGEVEVRIEGAAKNFSCELDEISLVDEEHDKECAKLIQKEIDQTSNLLEQAFARLEKAREMAEQNNITLFYNYDNLVNTKELENIFDQNGWSSSSLRC